MSEVLFHPVHALTFAAQRRDELAGERKRATFTRFTLRRKTQRVDRVAEAHRASLSLDPRDSAILAAAR